jgi:hypothetical protein
VRHPRPTFGELRAFRDHPLFALTGGVAPSRPLGVDVAPGDVPLAALLGEHGIDEAVGLVGVRSEEGRGCGLTLRVDELVPPDLEAPWRLYRPLAAENPLALRARIAIFGA